MYQMPQMMPYQHHGYQDGCWQPISPMMPGCANCGAGFGGQPYYEMPEWDYSEDSAEMMAQANQPMMPMNIGPQANQSMMPMNIGPQANQSMMPMNIGPQANQSMMPMNVGPQANQPMMPMNIGPQSNQPMQPMAQSNQQMQMMGQMNQPMMYGTNGQMMSQSDYEQLQHLNQYRETDDYED
jgi:morphogenetic protein associated with SpoVID